MSDEEILDLIKSYQFPEEFHRDLKLLCQDVARQSRKNAYDIIQHANNAMLSRDITSTELDTFLYNRRCFDKDKKAKSKPQ